SGVAEDPRVQMRRKQHSVVWGLLLSCFVLHNAAYIFNGTQFWTAGSHNLLLRSHSINVRNVAWHCLAEISRGITKKDVAWMAAYVALQPVCTFQH
ncbi:hypothetical protein ATANTOWER_014330, partial [Ataeniobius toweri]|nr:hypothetical protein [Ataeniobius toweri]